MARERDGHHPVAPLSARTHGVGGAIAPEAQWADDDAEQPILIGHVGDHPCAVPASAVERIVPMAALTRVPGLPDGVAGILDVHGSILAVVDPRPRFGCPTPAPHPDQHLVALHGRTRYLLWMDGVERIVAVRAADLIPSMGRGDHAPVTHLVRWGGATMPLLSVTALDPGPVDHRAEGPTT